MHNSGRGQRLHAMRGVCPAAERLWQGNVAATGARFVLLSPSARPRVHPTSLVFCLGAALWIGTAWRVRSRGGRVSITRDVPVCTVGLHSTQWPRAGLLTISSGRHAPRPRPRPRPHRQPHPRHRDSGKTAENWDDDFVEDDGDGVPSPFSASTALTRAHAERAAPPRARAPAPEEEEPSEWRGQGRGGGDTRDATRVGGAWVVSASVIAVPSPAAASMSAATHPGRPRTSSRSYSPFVQRSRKRKDRQRESSMNFHPSAFRRSAVVLQDPLPPRLHAHDFGAGASFRPGSVQSDYMRRQRHIPQHHNSAAPPASAEYYNYGASQAYAPPQNLGHAPRVQQVGIHIGYPPELHRQGAFPGVPVHPNLMPPPPPPAHHQHYAAEDNDDTHGGI
ncbi:hypothetical protein GGX14DRAFT_644526 [Mycena pura]|uniref:Uncharacterized protein n=1 Tax=Mycena pura TaxID=153505 RepID=A0AAD6Y7C7_9AGAR|nr:hypothetical protein GGX14DRAFT_644526 [Mycena pura]